MKTVAHSQKKGYIKIMELEIRLHTNKGQLNHDEFIMPCMESVFDLTKSKLYHFRSISL